MKAASTLQPARFYEFGSFLVDATKCVLLRDGAPVPLTPKAFEILLVLIRNQGRVVEKEELMNQVWPDTFVEENNLARNISMLRKALGEDPTEHGYIMTVPGRGYRFVASLREVEEARVGARAAASPVVALERQIKHPGRGWGLAWVMLVVGMIVVAAVVTSLRQRSSLDQGWPQQKLWQLTFDPGLEGEPTWSPDGNLIAYSSNHGGNFDIWVRPVGEGQAVRVTTSPAHDWQPDWAPAGNRLVFRSERDGGGLYVVPVLGGNERKVSSFGYRPHWSPDGRQILFYSSILQYNTIEIPKVFVVGLDGHAPREVLGEFLTEFNWLRVAWHPDGQRVSVWGDHRQQGWSFWTVPLAGGAPTKSELTRQVSRQLGEAAVMLTDFQWSPDGRSLYFEGVSQSVRNIWKVQVEPQSLRWTSGPERLTTGAGQDTELTISPDGQRLAFTIRAEHTRLWSLPFDAATGRVKGTPQPLTEADANASFPALSPTREQLVFRAQRADKEELRIRSLKDGHETVLLSDDCSRAHLRWSRDGLRLAYLRLRPLNPERTRMERSFVLLSVGGGDEQVLASSDATRDVPYDWSADGQWILVGTDRQSPGRRALGLFPIAAAPHAETHMRVLTSHPEQNLWQACFSPDNRWISFCAANATAAGISTIYVIPAAGGEWKQITEGKYFDDKPRWSPDGKILYFISSRTGFFNVWGIRFDPASGQTVGDPFRVTDFESPGQMILTDVRTMEMTLGADRLILPIMEVSGDIWILENLPR